jgi:hypothetical protein
MLFDVTQHQMRQKYDHEWGINKNLEGVSHGIFQDTMLAFNCKHGVKLKKP